jgi:hypothetical protein
MCFNYQQLVILPCALTEHHAMKGCSGSGCIAPRILDLGTSWMWVVSFMADPWNPLDRRLGGPQSRSGQGGEKISSPYRDSNPPIIQLVHQLYTTELSRLLQDLRLFEYKHGCLDIYVRMWK